MVVGSVAFQTYPDLLEMWMPAALSRTDDLDVGQSQSIAVAVEDRLASDLETVLRKVDDRFTAIPNALDGWRTMRYSIRWWQDEIFSVDILSPMQSPELPRIGSLPAIRSDAQFLGYLDFLLYYEVNSVALQGAGIPINVPDPTRYALHKLIVSQMRVASDAPDDLRDLWLELCERALSWRWKAMRALSQLPPEMAATCGADPEPGRDDRDAASADVAQAGDEVDETSDDTLQPTWDA